MIGEAEHVHRGRRLWRLAVLVVVAVLAALAGCGDDGDASAEKTFRDDAFSLTFKYPDNFKSVEASKPSRSAGGEPVAHTALAIDEANAIFVARYDLEAAVTSDNLPSIVPEVDSLVSQLAAEPARGRTIVVGGLPAIEYDDVDLEEPPEGKSRLVAIFDGPVEYMLNCQSTPEERKEITRGCDLALRTLTKT